MLCDVPESVSLENLNVLLQKKGYFTDEGLARFGQLCSRTKLVKDTYLNVH